MADNGEGMPKESHVGWQPGIDFEVDGAGPWRASAWDEDVCVAVFETRNRLVLLVRLWAWHWQFNRKPRRGGK